MSQTDPNHDVPCDEACGAFKDAVAALERPTLDAHLEGRRIVVDTPVELHMTNDGLWDGHSLTLTVGPGNARIEGTVQQEARPTSEAVREALATINDHFTSLAVSGNHHYSMETHNQLATITAELTDLTAQNERLTAELAIRDRAAVLAWDWVARWFDRYPRDAGGFDGCPAYFIKKAREEATDAE